MRKLQHLVVFLGGPTSGSYLTLPKPSLDCGFTGIWGFLFQVLIWVRENPLTFLTGPMTFVTALYALSTTKYVEIVTDQFATQTGSAVGITLENRRWPRRDEFSGTILIEDDLSIRLLLRQSGLISQVYYCPNLSSSAMQRRPSRRHHALRGLRVFV